MTLTFNPVNASQPGWCVFDSERSYIAFFFFSGRYIYYAHSSQSSPSDDHCTNRPNVCFSTDFRRNVRHEYTWHNTRTRVGRCIHFLLHYLRLSKNTRVVDDTAIITRRHCDSIIIQYRIHNHFNIHFWTIYVLAYDYGTVTHSRICYGAPLRCRPRERLRASFVRRYDLQN